MNKLIQAVLLVLVGLVVLAAASRALVTLSWGFVPVAVCAAVLRVVWWLTGPR